jgi:hypothetical protein
MKVFFSSRGCFAACEVQPSESRQSLEMYQSGISDLGAHQGMTSEFVQLFDVHHSGVAEVEL